MLHGVCHDDDIERARVEWQLLGIAYGKLHIIDTLARHQLYTGVNKSRIFVDAHNEGGTPACEIASFSPESTTQVQDTLPLKRDQIVKHGQCPRAIAVLLVEIFLRRGSPAQPRPKWPRSQMIQSKTNLSRKTHSVYSLG